MQPNWKRRKVMRRSMHCSKKWIQERKDALIHELTVQGKRNLLDERMLNDTDKTVTVTLTEDNYRKLINAMVG